MQDECKGQAQGNIGKGIRSWCLTRYTGVRIGVVCTAVLTGIDRHRAASPVSALERQDLSCTYLAHHELESAVIIIVVIKSSQSLWGEAAM